MSEKNPYCPVCNSVGQHEESCSFHPNNLKKRAVVKQEDRQPNEVDELLEQVENIQANCKHDFRLFEEMHSQARETLVKGVFFVPGYVKTKCLKCSQELLLDPVKTCPRCFGQMSDVSHEGHGSCERYTGKCDLGCSYARVNCNSCGLGLVYSHFPYLPG